MGVLCTSVTAPAWPTYIYWTSCVYAGALPDLHHNRAIVDVMSYSSTCVLAAVRRVYCAAVDPATSGSLFQGHVQRPEWQQQPGLGDSGIKNAFYFTRLASPRGK